MVDHTLEELESLLDPRQFFRISRKFIVNVNAIAEIKGLISTRLEVKLGQPCEHDLSVSRDRVADFPWCGRDRIRRALRDDAAEADGRVSRTLADGAHPQRGLPDPMRAGCPRDVEFATTDITALRRSAPARARSRRGLAHHMKTEAGRRPALTGPPPLAPPPEGGWWLGWPSFPLAVNDGQEEPMGQVLEEVSRYGFCRTREGRAPGNGR